MRSVGGVSPFESHVGRAWRGKQAVFLGLFLGGAAGMLISCSQAPGEPGRGTFRNERAGLALSSNTRAWKSSEALYGDEATTYGDIGTMNDDVSAPYGTPARPPLLASAVAAIPGLGWFLSYSQFDAAYGGQTGQDILGLSVPAASESLGWSSVLGSAQIANSGLAYSYSFAPSAVVDPSGRSLWAFVYDTAGDYLPYAWVRHYGDSAWRNGSGVTTTPDALADGFPNRINPLSYGMCPPRWVSDYRGGFLAVWCGEDDGTQANAYMNHYVRSAGWYSTPRNLCAYTPTTATPNVCATSHQGLQLSGRVYTPGSQNFSSGVDGAFFPDGSGYGLVVQTVDDTGAAGNYNFAYRFFNPAAQDFYGTTLSDLAGVGYFLSGDFTTDEVYSPRLMTTSDYLIDLTFISLTHASCAAPLGALMEAQRTYTPPSATAPATDSLSAAVNPTLLDCVSMNSSSTGQFREQKVVRSVDGSISYLAYLSDDTTVRLRRWSSGSWAFVGDFSYNGRDVADFELAVNASGDASLLVAFEDTSATPRVDFVGWTKRARAANWSSSQLLDLSGLQGTSVKCQASETRLSLAMDSQGTGVATASCLPIQDPPLGGEVSRQLVLRFY